MRLTRSFAVIWKGDHGFDAPRSVSLPSFTAIRDAAAAMGDWYAVYVQALMAKLCNEPIAFHFSNGAKRTPDQIADRRKEPPMPNLADHPIHLGRGASASTEPAFTGPEWYEDYGARTAADGVEGRLVQQYDFAQSWDSWEVHPNGAEVVVCVAGGVTLIQQHPDGREEHATLGPGDYAINPPGIWHTADIAPGQSATCIFITPGMGTEHRPR